MLSALVAAPLCVWVTDALVTRPQVRQELFGRTMYDLSGGVQAIVVSRDQVLSPWPAGATPISEFRLVDRFVDRGWPVTTTRIDYPPRVDITLIVDRTNRENVAHDTSDAETAAIDTALRYREHDALVDEWAAAQQTRDTYVLGWVFGSVLWCVMLWVVLLVVFNVARVVVFGMTAKRQLRGARLRGQNCCVNCGYDLRGLEFNERCPECGHLSW